MTGREAMQQAKLEKLEGDLWILSQQLTRKQAEIDALRKRLADNAIHSCSYYCERPECVKEQRDELRELLAGGKK